VCTPGWGVCVRSVSPPQVSDTLVCLSLINNSGGGDVMNAEGGVIGIGSGGFYATAAARALVTVDGLDIEDIAQRSMTVAADLCVYTNHNFTTVRKAGLLVWSPHLPAGQGSGGAAPAISVPRDGRQLAAALSG
jgi:hypothetical protein